MFHSEGSEGERERIRLLSLVDIFEPLSSEEIERLRWQLPDRRLEAGETFFAPHDRSEKLFVLQKGKVRIYKTPDGHEITLAVVESGTVFGEMTLTGQELRGAYAQAMEPSEVSILGREDLERLILEKPEVGLQIAHLLSERLRRYETRLEDVTLREVHARLASLILALVESEGLVIGRDNIRIPTHYTHQHLGTMIGANREAVTRAFGHLQDEGAIELKRRLIHVTDADTLKTIAGEYRGGVEERTP